MHDVQPVQWDDDVYASAKNWAQKTGTTMRHSSSSERVAGTENDGENLAGTSAYSKHAGVDAVHMWYAEIQEPCGWKQSCFQSFTAGHFTAMIWKTINRIAYSDTSKKLAVGRYRGCDGKGPNFNNMYKTMVPPPKYTWDACVAKVSACPAFTGLKFGPSAHAVDGVEGCDGSSKAKSCPAGMTKGSGDCDSDGWLWYKFYASSCKAKYAGILGKITMRRYDIHEALIAPIMANPWPLAIVGGLVFVAAVIMITVRRSRVQEFHHDFLVAEEAEETGLSRLE